MERQISVFISSSQIELENEREICAEVVHSINLQPILFELSSALSSNPYSAFLKDVENCDIFVLILWKSFSEAVQAEYRKAVEKNKPVLIFIKDCRYSEQRTPELEKFLNGFSKDKKEHIITSYTYFRKLSELKEKLKQAITTEIGKFYEEPICTLSRENMYELGTDIIKYAQKRLIVYQRTPTLFLGKKDRMKSNRYTQSFQIYEEKYENALINWIEKHENISDTEFIYLFDMEASKRELQEALQTSDTEEKIIKLNSVKDNFRKYKEIEEETNYRFKITPLDNPVSGPFYHRR